MKGSCCLFFHSRTWSFWSVIGYVLLKEPGCRRGEQMWKQTLKSSVALIEVVHKIFRPRSVWSGCSLGHLSLHVFVFSDCSLKRMKSTPAARWLQFPATPTSVKYSVHICILHDYGKQGKQHIRKQLFIGRAAFLSQTLLLQSLFLHCSHADTKASCLVPSPFQFPFCTCPLFLSGLSPFLKCQTFGFLIFI